MYTPVRARPMSCSVSSSGRMKGFIACCGNPMLSSVSESTAAFSGSRAFRSWVMAAWFRRNEHSSRNCQAEGEQSAPLKSPLSLAAYLGGHADVDSSAPLPGQEHSMTSNVFKRTALAVAIAGAFGLGALATDRQVATPAAFAAAPAVTAPAPIAGMRANFPNFADLVARESGAVVEVSMIK